MQRKPRNPKENIVSKNMILNIITTGLLFAVVTLAIFRFNFGDLEKARTMTFTTLVLFQLARAYIVRANYTKNIFSNKSLTGAIGLSFLLQLLVLYSPLNSIFKTVPLGLIDWGLILTVTLTTSFVGRVIDKIIRKVTQEYD
jgi:Ca2+-transporting ATPase